MTSTRLQSGELEGRKWIFAEYNARACVRNQRWKLYSDGRFYDVALDPDEVSALNASELAGDALLAYQELTTGFDGLGFATAK